MSDFHGFAAHAAGAELLPYKYDPGDIGHYDVAVSITHCGVCHSDLHLIDNDWGSSKYPFVPGHEIVGSIVQVGSAVRDRKIGERVGIGWQADSCGTCEWCRRGEEHLCPKSQRTCVGRNGGYADRIRVNSRFAVPIPKTLESENVAPLLCAGLTVYSPLRNHLARPSSRVGVVGIGGLGHIALQFARAFGCEVTAFSTSKDKEAEALALGAHHFVNTRENGNLKKLAGSLDIILSTVSGDQDFQSLLAALRPKGTLVVLGVPPSPLQILASGIVSGQKSIAGSPIGSPGDTREMLDVAARHNIKAIVECFPMKNLNEAITSVKKNQVRYRAVLTNA